MEFDINNLTLIDLISEKHSMLRKKVENEWNKESDVLFSHSEWHLLAKIEQLHLTISQAAVTLGVSRQAMHKTVTKLEKQNVITATYEKDNKRDKILKLTRLGNECVKKNNALKEKLDKRIEEVVGTNNFEIIKALLKDTWLP